MHPLATELARLYAPEPTTAQPNFALVSERGLVRTMVLALGRPADWSLMSTVWRGVQTDLELPAPAIAVSGRDSYQLWFSLAEAVSAEQAHRFMQALRMRYLPEVKPERVRCWPMPASSGELLWTHADQVPAVQSDTGNWSAFVTPDLAPVLADEPWLDMTPTPDAQAQVLSRLRSIPAAVFQTACDSLQGAVPSAPPQAALSALSASATPPTEAAITHYDTHAQEARRFLWGVMQDTTVDLRLRIEAAKALL
ncbi:hypothetical protein [Rhodoferax aquaticus]|uniref:Uncharacterized protein n=1 Tax=Rhodoferax aquaticus TaxID=2527691 RepID=A0A515ET96_9BURK|nr:hypothetical protein [Rhodoferax aquaticus]QDL55882.1 hypothetical protein EXZ61_17825 [Rhodoferax aquaticus]